MSIWKKSQYEHNFWCPYEERWVPKKHLANETQNRCPHCGHVLRKAPRNKKRRERE